MAIPRRLPSRALLRRGAAAGLLTAALGLAAVFFPPTGRRLANLSYDALFLVPEVRPLPREAVIVRMDERSRQELGQNEVDRWDRTIHAEAIERLRAAGVRAVVFDVFFGVPQTNRPGADEAFVAAARRFGRVVIAAVPDEGREGGQIILPFEQFATNLAYGVAERAAVFRRPWWNPNSPVPSLAMKAAEFHGATGGPPPGAWLRYYGPARKLDALSLVDVVRSNAAAASNRVAFLGKDLNVPFFDREETDMQRTPHTRWTGERMPGVEVLTTVFLNLVRGEWILTLSPWRQFGWIAGLGFFLGGGLRLLRPKFALLLALAGAAGVTVAAIHFGWRHHVTWPWAVLVLVQVPAALVWSVVAHYHELIVARATTPRTTAAPTPSGGPAPDQQETQRTPGFPLPDSAPTPTGRPVVPNYEMISCVGRGGYGEVWLARDLVGSHLAVKLIFRRTFEDDRPYQREFRGMSMFSPVSRLHPGLVHVLHIGRNEAAGYFYYVMEPADDERRGTVIDPRTYQPKTLEGDLRVRGKYPLPEAVQLGIALGDALAFLHGHRLIHRDIKPANILFVRGQPKLADIGLVTRLAERPEDTTYLGTRGFIAPEGPGSASADVYGLAKVLFVAVTGGNPNDYPPSAGSASPAAQNPALTGLLRVLERACANHSESRYQTADEFVTALRGVARDIARPAPSDFP